MHSPAERLKRAEEAFFRPFAWASAALVLPLVAIILVSVVTSALRVNTLARWETPVPLFGTAITLNSLIDLQWYLFAIGVMLAAAPAWSREQHVRVDFIYETLQARARAAVNLVGHLVFALPFLILLLPATYRTAMTSYVRGEGSAQGGLIHTFVVKAFMPFGFSLLLAFVAVDIVRQALIVFTPTRNGGAGS
ncbi:TRAP transporter small permease subunit [Arenibaculum pallidiluteum]|uniref:TRAP transporter small permease subunit n=1 Tax=Arenibaculum pallidiluteum TaxID=2812559 RepID=UPI001A95AEFC|nr:TRAP transporter small permease subunit [Arenibaculum pallidiluteum]